MKDRFAARGRNKAQTRRGWALYTRFLYSAKSPMLVLLLYWVLLQYLVTMTLNRLPTDKLACVRCMLWSCLGSRY